MGTKLALQKPTLFSNLSEHTILLDLEEPPDLPQFGECKIVLVFAGRRILFERAGTTVPLRTQNHW